MLSTMCVPKHEQLIMLSVCGTFVVCSPELRVAYYIKISLFKLRTMLELCCWAFVLSAQSFDVFVGASVPLVRPSSESPIISYVRCLNWRSYAAEPAVSSAQLCVWFSSAHWPFVCLSPDSHVTFRCSLFTLASVLELCCWVCSFIGTFV